MSTIFDGSPTCCCTNRLLFHSLYSLSFFLFLFFPFPLLFLLFFPFFVLKTCFLPSSLSITFSINIFAIPEYHIVYYRVFAGRASERWTASYHVSECNLSLSSDYKKEITHSRQSESPPPRFLCHSLLYSIYIL